MDKVLTIVKKTGVVWLLLFVLLSGCGGEEPEQAPYTPTQEVEEQPAATAAPTALPTATVERRPTITPEPTPVTPALSVNDQTVSEDGVIQIASASSPYAAWVVVQADDEDGPGSVLGYTAVAPGTSESLNVSIDPYSATSTLYASLHLDAGREGEFEYPGSDMPLETTAGDVSKIFTVEFDMPLPSIEISDQRVAMDGLVNVDEAFTLQQGWLVVHTLQDGVIGPAIGQAPLDEGQNSDIEVTIRWRDATAELMAMLHQDNERPGGFNPANDLPIQSLGAPVTAEFAVELPPDIFVYDQPIVNNKISLERVISEEPGWIAFYSSADGQPDRIIGSVKVDQGINYYLDAELAGAAATPEIFLILHYETNNPAEFNFPLADPVATYDDEAITPTIMHTNPGNYLITTDQSLGEENEVVVPLVVADLDTWLVIYTQTENGSPDKIIGEGWLPAGVNRDVRIAIPAGMEGETLLAVLHLDGGNPREFDYPDGDDVPLQRNRQIVFSPFLIEARPEVSTINPK